MPHPDPTSKSPPLSREAAYLDPYRFLPPVSSDASDAASEEEIEEEPVTTGTLFLTMIILMIIAGLWVVAYAILLEH